MIKDYIKTEDLKFVVGLAAKFAKNKDPRILGCFREGKVEIRRESWGRLTVCATDGARLAVTRQQGYKEGAEPWKVVFTYPEAKRLLELCKGSGGRLDIDVHPQNSGLAERLVSQGYVFKGLNERFPDFEKVQPETFETSVDLPSTFFKTLRQCIEKIETFTTKEKVMGKTLTHKIRTLQVSLEQGYIQISKGQIGNVGEDDKDVEKRRLPIYALHNTPENILSSVPLGYGGYNGEAISCSPIILNVDYLLEGVRGLGSDVTFHSNGPYKSLTFSDPSQQNAYILMPVKGSVYR